MRCPNSARRQSHRSPRRTANSSWCRSSIIGRRCATCSPTRCGTRRLRPTPSMPWTSQPVAPSVRREIADDGACDPDQRRAGHRQGLPRRDRPLARADAKELDAVVEGAFGLLARLTRGVDGCSWAAPCWPCPPASSGALGLGATRAKPRSDASTPASGRTFADDAHTISRKGALNCGDAVGPRWSRVMATYRLHGSCLLHGSVLQVAHVPGQGLVE
jgi:hypothetical protein